MAEGRELRFVKTPGGMPLPENFKRQYRVFQGQSAENLAPVATFNLEEPHLRGVTEVRRAATDILTLTALQVSGAGRWQLTDEVGEILAEISGRGVLSQGWALSSRGEEPEFELVNPQGLTKQVITTMLEGETEGLVLKKSGNPIGSLTKQHRSMGGGVLAGLKRFVEGRDWVLKLDDQPVGANRELALMSFSLVAIVSLEFSSPD
ncbi:hypothetical protein [Roseibium sp.]|uniref:hypothetical protein n=1 Tax=Roseibium sp. TaxID=1936156 RepID=UPI003BB15E4F